MHENLLDGMHMKILILGGTGFVGRNLSIYLCGMGQHVVGVGRGDSGNIQSLHEQIKKNKPDAVINAAGMKDLRECQSCRDEAVDANSQMPWRAATICFAENIPFVQISSDHVLAEPVSIYAASKFMGEAEVYKIKSKSLIIRTGHVYDNDCPWVQWLDGELRAGRTVEAWTDIVARPTYARNLAEMILDLLQRKVTGTVNCVSKRLVTRLELFSTYADRAGYNPDLVVPCPTPCPSPYHIRKLYCECTYDGPVAVQDITEGFRRMVTERTREELHGKV